jgi:nucleoside-diphosphate-sugar epimerase
MNVLLTGHAGYIGVVAARVLQDAGHQVTGLDTGFFAECGLPMPIPAIRECRKDLRDVEPSDLEGFDAVVHLAALCNDPLGDLDPALTADINHLATIRLAAFARDAGVKRFVYASSCSLYGAAKGEDLLTEQAPMRPLTPYAVSKVRSEEDLSALATAEFSPVYLRNATAYGLSARLRGDIVLNNLVGWAHTTGRIQLLSDGTAFRPIVHVEDIARVCGACLEAPRAAIHDQALNVGLNEENYQVRELAEIVRETVPGSVVEYAREGGSDPRNYRVDFGKLKRTFPNLALRWTARDGAREIYQALQTHDIDRDTFLGCRFIRLKQIRRLRERGQLEADLRWARSEVAV